MRGKAAVSLALAMFLSTSPLGWAWSDAVAADLMWTLSWQQTAPFGGPAVCFSAAFAIGDRAYVGTGYGPTREFWQYDPETDGWTRKADFGGTARGAATAFSIGDKGYVGFGYDGTGQRSDLWEYDPLSDHWTQRASLPGAARDHAVAFTIGQRAYVVSGTSGEGAGTVYLREVWEYDPAGNQWTQRASIPEAAAASAAFVLGGKGYVATGVVSQSPSPVLTKKL